jgi:Glycosyl transferase family 2/Glycosyl transferases group 1
MGEPLHVLVYGSIDAGACDSVRLGVYRELLRDHGIEMRTWGEINDYRVQIPAAYADRLDDAIRDGVASVDMSPIDWADVLVFRRWYGTVHACDDCDFAGPDAAALAAHASTAGHQPVTRDRIVRSLLGSIETDPAVLRGRAVVYELDDDLFSPQPWLGFYRRLQGDRDLIERFARRADLVTVTTPALARSLGRYNSAVRVIRNAVDPERYKDVEPETGPRPLSFLYYGVAPRRHDYEICRDAVDAAARTHGGTRIWLGSDEPEIRALVDRAYPYENDPAGFAARLAAARPAIGLAPVGQDDFSRGHSELHWLEYSMAGAATVASRTMGGGPYDVIRDGVDGLLARNKAEWREKLDRLAGSADMRQELAGRARERVLAEYDVRKRAAEWADAFRWAADHAGRGMATRPNGVTVPRRPAAGPAPSRRPVAGPAQDDTELVADSRAGLAHRQYTRRRAVEERETLARLRDGRDVCWPENSAASPLVTVRIPTYDRGPLIVDRAIGSALAQTYRNLEILVVGDGATPDTVDAIEAVRDPRVRFVNLPRPEYPSDPERRWQVAGTAAVNHALDLARGAWIAPLDDDDEFTPDHVELLLAAAIEYRLEMVYGQSLMERPDGSWGLVGAWPPAQAGLCHGSALYAAELRFMKYDPDAWRLAEPGDWNLWHRMLDAGVRMGNLEQVVYCHYQEARHRSAVA